MNLKFFEPVFNKYHKSVECITDKLEKVPKVAVIAGSGISGSFNKMNVAEVIPYSEIPNMPKTTVEGHKGDVFIYNCTFDKDALVFSGRFHHYEGRKIDEICSLVIMSYLLGINKIIITNAAGALNPKFKVGDIMLIEDVLDFMFLKSENIEILLNQSTEYSKVNNIENSYSQRFKELLNENKIHYQTGVYAAVTGPNYETRAEIRMLRKLGADAVGMSTVPEYKLAKILGLEIIAASLITNSAKEVIQSVSHDEVIQVANNSVDNLRRFIETAIVA